MKIFIISDMHFGKYALDTDKLLENMNNYFYQFFIPFIKEVKKTNDKLVVLGDIFDNRTSINTKVLNSVVKLFETLSKIIEIHIILGNHDIFAMTDPEINSVVSIRNISNIIIYNEPTLVTFDNTKCLFMPLTHGKNDEKTILEQYSGQDILFCHSDLNGCRTQLNPTRPFNRHILDINDFTGYKKIYSGHIHIVQQIQNFTFVGSPYHLDRNDVENTKGIFVYDTKKQQDIFIPNDFSPEFKKIKIYQQQDFIKLQEELKTNNFIDIEISNTLLINNPKLRLDLDKLTEKYKIQNLEYINDVVKINETKIYKDIKNKSIKDLSFDLIDNLQTNIDLDLFNEIELKNKMKEKIEECFSLIEINKK